MKKHALPYIALGLVAFLGLLHFVANFFYLYWTIWWFDNMMHLLAGFSGGFIIVWFLASHRTTNLNSAIIIVASVLIVGIFWEIFEYINDIVITAENYTLDTSLDLLFDLLGASLACYIGIKKVFTSDS